MYQEHREEVILCIWNKVRCSSCVSGTQGGGLMCHERSEVLLLCIRNTVRSSYISGTQ